MNALILVFVATSGSRADAEPHLESWARARLERLEDATEGQAATYERAVVDDVEALLEEARSAADAHDEAAALDRLSAAERLLRAHPELPQAAWLLAERLELEAGLREARADGTHSSDELRRAARALEGERATTFAPEETAPDRTPNPELGEQRVSIAGLRPGDALYWDGGPAGSPLAAVAGEHHARVVRRGRAVWAGFVEVPAGGGSVTLGVPLAEACTLDELGAVEFDAGRVIAPAGTRCARWAVARSRIDGGIEIATCEQERCGPLLEWRRGWGGDYRGPPQPKRDPEWPAWATWVAVGAGALVVTGVVVWQTGVFDDPEPGRTRVVYYGPAALAF